MRNQGKVSSPTFPNFARSWRRGQRGRRRQISRTRTSTHERRLYLVKMSELGRLQTVGLTHRDRDVVPTLCQASARNHWIRLFEAELAAGKRCKYLNSIPRRDPDSGQKPALGAGIVDVEAATKWPFIRLRKKSVHISSKTLPQADRVAGSVPQSGQGALDPSMRDYTENTDRGSFEFGQTQFQAGRREGW